MEAKSASSELKDKIQFLELQQTYEEQLLKEQWKITYERLSPVNLLKSTLQEFISKPSLADKVLGTTMGLVTGYLSNKIVVGTSGNMMRKLFGLLMQVGVTNSVEQHPGAIKSVGRLIYNYFLKRKENNS